MPFCCSWNYTNLTSPILLNIKFLVLSLMFYKSQWCPLWSFLLSFCGLCQADTMPSTSVNTSQHVLLLNSLWFRCFWKKWTISLKLPCRTWTFFLKLKFFIRKNFKVNRSRENSIMNSHVPTTQLQQLSWPILSHLYP